MELSRRFERIFAALEAAGYDWVPRAPERLIEERKVAESYPPLERAFGLGAFPEQGADLARNGLKPEDAEWAIAERPAVSRVGGVWIAHDHWPPRPGLAESYAHLGPESVQLLGLLRERAAELRGARLLDLGSGAGALSLGLGDLLGEALGLDISERAVAWAAASASAQGKSFARFARARIGSPEADAAAGDPSWDAAVFNPPMMIPLRGQELPHRDGGPLGIELPILFLEFCRRRLRREGQAMGLVTNPVVAGKGLFFDQFDALPWRWLERERVHPHFNQSVARKEGYRERLGVERVELWFIRASLR
ncbi:MAG: methyltransferase domain-containing protein [Bdellovibrionales bacterium]|nr:methyltransferase domain-containing protein [Bdellovibrionales bacterium]